MKKHPLAGIHAAALTPLQANDQPDLESIPQLLSFLAERGCHGALLLGTTGEGPSFGFEERLAIMRAALAVRQEHPDFRLLAGTGTPSLTETILLSKTAFDIGYDGVVTLPPYYFRTATQEGLFAWFRQILNRAIPSDGYLLGYHIPAVSGVPLHLDLLQQIKNAFPNQFAGIKDSSGDPTHAKELGQIFGDDLVVLTGNDALLSLALENQAAGCITAMANLFSPDLRIVWEAHRNGQSTEQAQRRLNTQHEILGNYQPFAASIKALLAHYHDFPNWPVRPPLVPLAEDQKQRAIQALDRISIL